MSKINPTTRNILVTLLGVIVGSIVNMSIINIGPSIIPLPEGVTPGDMESLKEHIADFTARDYIIPFLAHALGTLIAAFIAVRMAVSRHKAIATIIGIWFLLGGISVNYMLGTPLAGAAFDIVLAYLPMAWIGYRLGLSGK